MATHRTVVYNVGVAYGPLRLAAPDVRVDITPAAADAVLDPEPNVLVLMDNDDQAAYLFVLPPAVRMDIAKMLTSDLDADGVPVVPEPAPPIIQIADGAELHSLTNRAGRRAARKR